LSITGTFTQRFSKSCSKVLNPARCEVVPFWRKQLVFPTRTRRAIYTCVSKPVMRSPRVTRSGQLLATRVGNAQLLPTLANSCQLLPTIGKWRSTHDPCVHMTVADT